MLISIKNKSYFYFSLTDFWEWPINLYMEEKILSIIVPVYNTEVFLKDCIESILKQKFEKFELILVDDGSTDKSGIICDQYKKKDSRI